MEDDQGRIDYEDINLEAEDYCVTDSQCPLHLVQYCEMTMKIYGTCTFHVMLILQSALHLIVWISDLVLGSPGRALRLPLLLLSHLHTLLLLYLLPEGHVKYENLMKDSYLFSILKNIFSSLEQIESNVK